MLLLPRGPVVRGLVVQLRPLFVLCSLLLASQLVLQQANREHHLRDRPLKSIIPAIPTIEDQSAH